MSVIDFSCIILDFETTGFSAELDQVIEVGAVKILTDGKKETFQTFVNPMMELPIHIQKLTGISTAEVAEAPRAELVFHRLAEFVGDLPIFAHNASFDSKFYFTQMRRAGVEAKNTFFCTLSLSRKLYPQLNGHKLEDLCREFSITNSHAHRALADVEATLSLLKQICGHIKSETGRSVIDLPLLDKICQTPTERLNKVLTREISLF